MNERRVERVARAICWSINIDPDERLIERGSKADLCARWQVFIPWAQAAVKALENCLIPEYQEKTEFQKLCDFWTAMDEIRDRREERERQQSKREDSFVELD
jgi:hypothetical protein